MQVGSGVGGKFEGDVREAAGEKRRGVLGGSVT